MADISDLDEVNARIRNATEAQVVARIRAQQQFIDALKLGGRTFFFDGKPMASFLYREELPMTPVEKLIAERKQNAD